VLFTCVLSSWQRCICHPKITLLVMVKRFKIYFKNISITYKRLHAMGCLRVHPKVTSLVRTKNISKYFKCPTTKLLGYKVVSRLRIVSGVFEFFSPKVRKCLMCMVFNLKHEHFVNKQDFLDVLYASTKTIGT
jgi:hypothetical protein